MKCPYVVTRYIIQQVIFEYDKDGQQTMRQTVERNEAEFIDCCRQEYGAWKDGRCRYNQVD